MKTLVLMTATLMLTQILALPALAGPDSSGHDGGPKSRVHVIVEDKPNTNDTHVYQQWYGVQVKDFNDIDQETGERVGDLLQMVTDVNRDNVVLTDRDCERHLVMLTRKTAVILPNRTLGGGWNRGETDARNHDVNATTVLRTGDLVITSGYLKATGAFVATSLRVMGHARGYGNDGDTPNGQHGGYQPTYGIRLFGDVSSIDYRYGRMEVNTRDGRRVLYLAKGGDVLANGQRQTLQYLRRGDRIVFYVRDAKRWPAEAYRIVIMQKDDIYPDGDRPCCTDPDYKPGCEPNTPTLPMLEGMLDSLTTSVLFNKLTLRTNYGKTLTVFVPKTVDAFDSRGNRIALLNLCQGDRLQVYYNEVAGAYFAQQITVR